MPNRKGLGRGFDSLIPTELVESEFDTTGGNENQIFQVNVNLIDPNPHQPRTNFDPEAIAGLAVSIKEHGILQPLIVTKKGARYILIAGERRLRAAKSIKLDTVPAIVRSLDEQQKLELALIENIQRTDLNPIESATAYLKLKDQFNLSYEAIGKRVGKNVSTIVNIVRLLGLPLVAKRALVAGQITEGHARSILAVPGEEGRLELLNHILKEHWTVRQAEQFAKASKQTTDRTKTLAKTKNTNQQTEQLAAYLGTEVTIEPRAQGGRLVIRYKDDTDLERITKKIIGS